MELQQKLISERLQFEASRMGGYKLIFPAEDPAIQAKYQTMLTKAKEVWDEFFMGKQNKLLGKESPQK